MVAVAVYVYTRYLIYIRFTVHAFYVWFDLFLFAFGYLFAFTFVLLIAFVAFAPGGYYTTLYAHHTHAHVSGYRFPVTRFTGSTFCCTRRYVLTHHTFGLPRSARLRCALRFVALIGYVLRVHVGYVYARLVHIDFVTTDLLPLPDSHGLPLR